MREGKSAQVIPQTCCFVHSITETRGGEWAGVRGRINSRPEEEASVQQAGRGGGWGGEKIKKAVRERKKGDKVKNGRMESEKDGVKRRQWPF